jgi:hypothetical protein
MTSGRQFHVVWKIHPNHDLIQMAGLLSGFAALERRGTISISTEYVDSVVELSYSAMELTVTQMRSGDTRNIVFDFYDRGDKLIPSALEFADRYFKRQCGPDTRHAARELAPHKVLPLGLTVTGFSWAAWRLVRAAILGSLRSRDLRRTRGELLAMFRQAVSDFRLWLRSTPPESLLEPLPDAKSPHIVFQPRLWSTTPGSRDLFDVANEDRIETVRALRAAFPQEPAVGLVHTEDAMSLAPELMLAERVNSEQHRQQLRSSAIAVNCVGLSGSVGWKFAEYLAAGNAIVGQPLEKEFLAPVDEGVHYLPYRSPEECVAQCRKLLASPDLISRMRQANRAYYERWVHPPVHALHLLNRAFE